MQSAGDQRFKTMTMSHANALFQTALRLTENRAADPANTPSQSRLVQCSVVAGTGPYIGRVPWGAGRFGYIFA